MEVAGAIFLRGIDAAIRELENFIRILEQHQPVFIYWTDASGEEMEVAINVNLEEHQEYLEKLKDERNTMLADIPMDALKRITEMIEQEIEDQLEE